MSEDNLAMFFFGLFEEDFCFFCFDIFWPSIPLKYKNIPSNEDDQSECYLSEIIEDHLIVIDEEYTDSIDTDSPDDRADHIVYPELTFLHPTGSRDKWHKCSCKIMKFSEDNIPKSIFLDLLMEDRSFRLSDSEPVAVFFYKLGSIPFSYPVSEIISEHCSDDRTYDRA